MTRRRARFVHRNGTDYVFMVEVPGGVTTVTFYRVPVAEFWGVGA